MKYWKRLNMYFLLGLVAVLASIMPAAAQSLTIDQLVIQIWPEFDRPETLVIYKGQLAADVTIPATLKFDVPAGVGDMHAVAVMGPDGNLVNTAYDLTPVDASTAQLSFTVNNPRFQFEYYDPNLVVKEGVTRSLQYNGGTRLPINSLQIEIQQPTDAKNMEITPPADEVMTGSNNFVYYIYRRTKIKPGEFITLAGKYTKQTDALTTEMQVGIPQPTTVAPPALPLTMPMPNNWGVTLGYVLLALGVGVLLIAGGIWIFNSSRADEPETEPARRPGRKRGSPPPPKPVRPASAVTTAGAKGKFCPECGARYKPGAKFCHQCGAPRR